ncbi:MAG: hypothetical protein K2P28_12985 [Lachnospiraceae bacterium]|nr:hypothetical protein [Lachnospiraceae bacterium]
MLEEQARTVRIFRENYTPDPAEKMVIYGTGIHAEAVISSCKDYPIEGLMDASRTGETLWGKPVMSEEEVTAAGIRLVVVAARPAVHTIIYKRIRQWSEKHAVRILDIEGNDIADKARKNTCSWPYFNKSYEELLGEIDRHDVISFDIFDTLLTRKVYEPSDVFTLLDLEYEERYPFVFSVERKRAQQELSETEEPDIHQIYRRMKVNNPCISKEECEALKAREIEKEKQVLTARRRMTDCLDYCMQKRKVVYLVSDMYLPGEILADILKEFGVTQYGRLFVSCDYGVTKQNGLFQIMKKQAPAGHTFLHIGDHPIADGERARENGIDDFLILSPARMMEISSYAGLLVHMGGIESRIMLGLLMSEVFNDPFILYQSQGRPLIRHSRNFGYVFIAPLILSFLSWMIERLKGAGEAVMLFSARDGWLPEQLYHMLSDIFHMSGLPKSYYLLISRQAVQSLDGPGRGIWKERYLKYLEELHLTGKTAGWEEQTEDPGKQGDQGTVKAYEQIYFFDFMSRGTCQYHLERLIGREVHGLYVQKSVSGDSGKEKLKVESYYKEGNAVESDRRIFGLCDFLECIFTSFEPSFLGFSEDLKPVYEDERRSEEQLSCVQEIHEGIRACCRQFGEILHCFTGRIPDVDYCDEVLRLMGADDSRIEIPELWEMMLDDAPHGDKNTGRDALL